VIGGIGISFRNFGGFRRISVNSIRNFLNFEFQTEIFRKIPKFFFPVTSENEIFRRISAKFRRNFKPWSCSSCELFACKDKSPEPLHARTSPFTCKDKRPGPHGAPAITGRAPCARHRTTTCAAPTRPGARGLSWRQALGGFGGSQCRALGVHGPLLGGPRRSCAAQANGEPDGVRRGAVPGGSTTIESGGDTT